MKALFATVLTAMLALMAFWAYAAPLPVDRASLSVPAADDDDKDKEKDKKGD